MKSGTVAKVVGGVVVVVASFAATNYFLSRQDAPPVVQNDLSTEIGRMKQRISDLTRIRDALEAYHRDHKEYPKNPQFAFYALYNDHGPAAKDWIPGLAPKYLKELPRDPRNTTDGNLQYEYKSDGADYKIVAFNPENDCANLAQKSMIDPFRLELFPGKCVAIGFWTAGAERW